MWLRFREVASLHQVDLKMLRKAVAKLKVGKGSPDGCTAEMYKHIPLNALYALVSFYNHIFLNLLCF